MKFAFKKENSYRLLQPIKIIDGLFIEMQQEHRQLPKVGYRDLFLDWKIPIHRFIILSLHLHHLFHHRLLYNINRFLPCQRIVCIGWHRHRHHQAQQQLQRHQHIIRQLPMNQLYRLNLRRVLATRYKKKKKRSFFSAKLSLSLPFSVFFSSSSSCMSVDARSRYESLLPVISASSNQICYLFLDVLYPIFCLYSCGFLSLFNFSPSTEFSQSAKKQ